MKLCKDCKYYLEHPSRPHLSRCSHPDDVEHSVIDGMGSAFCELARHGGHCGVVAENFEPKKPDVRVVYSHCIEPKKHSFLSRFFGAGE